MSDTISQSQQKQTEQCIGWTFTKTKRRNIRNFKIHFNPRTMKLWSLFRTIQTPAPNCTSIKVYHIWRSPSHQLKLWLIEDEMELTKSVMVTKMELLKGVVSCLLFFRLISSRLKVFKICEWLNQNRSLRRADHGGKINEYCIFLNYIFAPCISNIKHLIVQLMHTNYKILRLLEKLKL